mmetsp:Transcript_11516/g.25509  ORF Transcript_11516/g.25509 Transcript_11516/m.25509 type:complete len:281 (+) Transcript_11516:384-1226(+)
MTIPKEWILGSGGRATVQRGTIILREQGSASPPLTCSRQRRPRHRYQELDLQASPRRHRPPSLAGSLTPRPEVWSGRILWSGATCESHLPQSIEKSVFEVTITRLQPGRGVPPDREEVRWTGRTRATGMLRQAAGARGEPIRCPSGLGVTTYQCGQTANSPTDLPRIPAEKVCPCRISRPGHRELSVTMRWQHGARRACGSSLSMVRQLRLFSSTTRRRGTSTRRIWRILGLPTRSERSSADCSGQPTSRIPTLTCDWFIPITSGPSKDRNFARSLSATQ